MNAKNKNPLKDSIKSTITNSGSAASDDYELYSNWTPTGVWQGRFSGGYGLYDDGLFGQGQDGYYWSSTASFTGYASGLGYFGEVYPGYGLGKPIGYAVRCAI